MTPYLTISDVCALLSVSERTVHQWMADKRLPFFRVGRVVRFHPAAVEAFVREWTVKTRFRGAVLDHMGKSSRDCVHRSANVSSLRGDYGSNGDLGIALRSIERHSHHEAVEQRDSAVAGKTRGGVSVEVREGNGKCVVASTAMSERQAA